jgi:hypothetical protein
MPADGFVSSMTLFDFGANDFFLPPIDFLQTAIYSPHP